MKRATMTIKGDVETLLDIVEDIIAIYDSNFEINLKIEEEKAEEVLENAYDENGYLIQYGYNT